MFGREAWLGRRKEALLKVNVDVNVMEQSWGYVYRTHLSKWALTSLTIRASK